VIRAAKGDARGDGRTAGILLGTIGGIKTRYGAGKDCTRVGYRQGLRGGYTDGRY